MCQGGRKPSPSSTFVLPNTLAASTFVGFYEDNKTQSVRLSQKDSYKSVILQTWWSNLGLDLQQYLRKGIPYLNSFFFFFEQKG